MGVVIPWPAQPFAVPRAPRDGAPKDAPIHGVGAEAGTAEIFLFLGVRYERHEDYRTDDGIPPPAPRSDSALPRGQRRRKRG